jgi:hypothetical protein
MGAALRADKNVLLTELGDGQAVLLHLDTKFYFTLNATGVAVWKRLERAGATEAELAEELSERFQVDVAAATRDLEPLLAEMIAEGLVATSA